MTNITTFTYLSNTVRVVMIDGNPWFVAKDVCVILGFHVRSDGSVNTTHALRHCSEDQIITRRLSDKRGAALKLISESGLYKLIMRSDKPEASKFQDWATREVLPAIRKDGVYVAAHFGKRHDHVFRDIRTLIPRIGERVLATELTLHTVNSEPRVLDTDLAERLGYEIPRQVRELIKRNETELSGYGILSCLTTNTGKRGRPGQAYCLNEEQALLVCILSKTENAALVHEPTPSDILRESEKRPSATHPSAAPLIALLGPPGAGRNGRCRATSREI